MSTLRKLKDIVSPPPSDIAIAQSIAPLPIDAIATAANIKPEHLEPYGR
jgi:hypothetical protein